MKQVDIDIKKTQDVRNIVYSPNYGKVYFKSNEFLEDLLKNIDLKDKSVLTVLGSGDQAFYAYDKDAKSVDVFDINRLAIYYFYLRIWIIEYLNKYYPQENFDKKYIADILKMVKPKTDEEQLAYEYWNKYINTYFIGTNSLFYKVSEIPEIKLSSLDKIKLRIKERCFNVYNIDISKPWNCDKKYDVIITSNISDYIPKNRDNFCFYRDNLERLLNDNGVVVCSKFNNHKTSSIEREEFKNNFIRRDFPKIWVYGHLESPGYSYKKR